MSSKTSLTVELRVNGEREAVLYRGEPLTFEVTIANPAAFRVQGDNLKLDRELAELEGRRAAGEVSQEDFERLRSQAEGRRREVSTVRVGSDSRPWFELITVQLEKDGKWEPLPWPLTLFSHRPAEASIELGSSYSAVAELDLEPPRTAEVPLGAYRVRCAFDAAPEGVVSSSPVSLTVKAKRKPKTEDLLKIGAYSLTRLAPAAALSAAASILKDEPNNIEALILRANSEDASGDPAAALRTLALAEEQWHAQGLDAEEGPRYIRTRMLQISQKLAKGQ